MAATVFNLNRVLPVEGGIYQWARAAFGDVIGFLVFWNVAGYALIVIAEVLYTMPSTIAYMVGPAAAWLPDHKIAAFTVSCSVLLTLSIAAVQGLSLGKWVHNVGSFSHMAAFAVLIALPIWALSRHTIAHWDPVPFAKPVFNLFFLAIFAQMLFGAQSGLEYVAILAGESKAPARTVSRSVVVASPVICAMFILGTSSVVAFVGSSKVNFISPIPQTIRIALGNTGVGSLLVTVAIAMLLLSAIGQNSLLLTGVTRLPMAAGWDHLAPKWFMRQHPKWGTPVNSIWCAAGMIAALLALSALGVKAQESNQLLSNASTVHYGLAYLVMFAIPMGGAVAIRKKLPGWLPWVAGLGFASTLFSVALLAYPFVDVVSPGKYAAKILGTVLVSNLLAVGLYFLRGSAPIAGSRELR
jgi:amino acid transporter